MVDKLTMKEHIEINDYYEDLHELCKRLEGEFDVICSPKPNVKLSIHESPDKGTVAAVYFYIDKIED